MPSDEQKNIGQKTRPLDHSHTYYGPDFLALAQAGNQISLWKNLKSFFARHQKTPGTH